MYAVMGITGQVGGATGRTLLAQGEQLRAIVRDPGKAAAWQQQGAELAVADFNDAAALANAFRGTDGVFVMLASNSAPSPDFAEARAGIQALQQALTAARPSNVVALSSIGSKQTSGLGVITTTHLLEEALKPLGLPVAFLRAGSFMQNYKWDLQAARYTGEIESFYAPADRPVPMVSTDDIGAIAARILTQAWTGIRTIEVAGPREFSPADAAAAFSKALNQQVLLKVLPRDAWEGALIALGMPSERTFARTDMVDSFNSGWIHFGVPGTESIRGTIDLDTAIAQIVSGA